MVFELHDMRMVCLLKAAAPHGLQIRFRSRYKSTTFIIPVRLRYYKPRSMSFIGRARASGPACLKQTLLRAWWADQCIFHVYYFGLLGEHLG